MNPATELENIGLTLAVTSGGKLIIEGLKRLTPEQREYAVTLAKEFKPFILEELGNRSRVVKPAVADIATVPPFCRSDEVTQ